MFAPLGVSATPAPISRQGSDVALDLGTFTANTIADGFSPDPRDREQLLKVPNLDVYDYGNVTVEIAAVCGVEPLPVCLANGRHHSHGGFGVSHILGGHGASLAQWDYHSVQDFVDHTAQTFDAVYGGRDRRLLLVSRHLRNPTMNRILVVEERAGRYFNVVTGWMVSASRRVNGTLLAERVDKNGVSVWVCRAPHKEGSGNPSPA